MTTELDIEVEGLMFRLAATDRKERVTRKQAQSALLQENVIKNGYFWTAKVKSVGVGIYDLWMEKR
jgi:hypothetical protein